MRLVERREALNLTQAQVAEKTGIQQANISRYETGGYKPKTEAALKLADLYGCTVKEIMEGCGPGEATDAGRVEESL